MSSPKNSPKQRPRSSLQATPNGSQKTRKNHTIRKDSSSIDSTDSINAHQSFVIPNTTSPVSTSKSRPTSTSIPNTLLNKTSSFHSSTSSVTSLTRSNSSSKTSIQRENVQVAVRVRPITKAELVSGEGWEVDEELNSITSNAPLSSSAPPLQFGFDHVYSGSDNKSLYESSIRSLVYTTMEGFNGTVFAYGQTSSGKTYTMMGGNANPGIIPHAIHDVFMYIQQTQGQREFLLRVSYMEVYNEQIRDLLSPENKNLRIHENSQRGVYVSPLKEEIVTSPNHVLNVIAKGEQNRHVSTTDYNQHSSRSHTIFQMIIESRDLIVSNRARQTVKMSSLNLIDLAGSEKAASNVDRRKEGAYINKSLLTLGTVIAKLTENKATHVPYRDSKLTRILQSSLSGNARVSVICTISPALSNLDESTNTLKFASRVKQVVTQAQTNHVMDDKVLIQKYRKEINELKERLVQTNDAFERERERQLELMQVKAEKDKFEEELHEQHLLRTAYKERIEHLTKMILTSGSVTAQTQAVPTYVSDESISTIQIPSPGDSPGIPLISTISTSLMDQLNIELASKETEISNLQNQLDAQSEQVAQYALLISTLEQGDLESAHQIALNGPNIVTSELSELRQKNRELEIVVNDAEDRLEELQQSIQIEQMQAEHDRLALQSQVDDLTLALDQVKAELKTAQVQAFVGLETREELNECKSELESLRQAHQSDLDVFKRRVHTLEQELAIAKAELTIARLSLSNATKP